jgi:hypothetical protein
LRHEFRRNRSYALQRCAHLFRILLRSLAPAAGRSNRGAPRQHARPVPRRPPWPQPRSQIEGESCCRRSHVQARGRGRSRSSTRTPPAATPADPGQREGERSGAAREGGKSAVVGEGGASCTRSLPPELEAGWRWGGRPWGRRSPLLDPLEADVTRRTHAHRILRRCGGGDLICHVALLSARHEVVNEEEAEETGEGTTWKMLLDPAVALDPAATPAARGTCCDLTRRRGWAAAATVTARRGPRGEGRSPA